MKNFFILLFAILFSFPAFAQRIKNIHEHDIQWINTNTGNHSGGLPSGRTTTFGDTISIPHVSGSDTITIYTIGTDSGYVTGTNYWNDKSAAERYDFYTYDSSIQVIGVFALFSGKVNPLSAQTVNFNVWNQTYPVPISGSLIYNGFPSTILASDTVSVTQLGIGATHDTLKEFLFATPTSFLSAPFFVGYSVNYTYNVSTGLTTNGDNFGLACSKNGERYPAANFTVDSNINPGIDTTVDTFINVQNATQGSDNTWYDNYTQNALLKTNLVIYPIAVIGYSTVGTSKITRNNLSFFGNYPNPANDYTNIRFSLSTGADVTVMIMDMAGHLLNTITQNKLTSGEHLINVNTSALPTGDYLYLIRTSAGDGIAGKLIKL